MPSATSHIQLEFFQKISTDFGEPLQLSQFFSFVHSHLERLSFWKERFVFLVECTFSHKLVYQLIS